MCENRRLSRKRITKMGEIVSHVSRCGNDEDEDEDDEDDEDHGERKEEDDEEEEEEPL